MAAGHLSSIAGKSREMSQKLSIGSSNASKAEKDVNKKGDSEDQLMAGQQSGLLSISLETAKQIAPALEHGKEEIVKLDD